jgi:diguanylate cyclase (GGDEF)-like protein
MRSLGYYVSAAPEGVTALDYLARREFDLVLLDVVMPLMSGVEVLKCIRCTYSVTDLPVIMITARDESDDIVHALESGANDYLTKPFALPVVSARVRTQLMLKRMVGELEKANLKLETLSLRDALTQVANRRSFDESFEREKRRVQRNGRSLTLLILDIDYFKKYNDTYGHKAGDVTLRRVAETIVESLGRASDMAFRYGGEEFVALLPHCDEKGARIVAERIRTAIERLAIPHAGSSAGPCLTVSIGAATTASSSDEELAALFDNADGMLYRAKDEGRNRVCYYGE